MNERRTSRKVSEEIRAAFAGVRLEGGIGLREARGIDDHASESALQVMREQDEEEDWAAIPVANLQKYSDTLSFFDAKGLRFHLPAFLIAHLEGAMESVAVYHLTHFTDWWLTKFSEFSSAQRRAVRSYLLLLRDDPKLSFEHEDICAALDDVLWKEEPNQSSEPMRAKGPHGSS